MFNWIKDNWYGIVTSGSNSNVFSGNFIFDNWIGVEESSSGNRYTSNSVYDNVEGIFINDGVNSSFKDNFVFSNYVGLFRYVTEDSSLVLDSVIENNTLADVQSFNTTGLVLQDSVWNCGPATLVNLFKLYGLDVSQDEIAAIAGTDSDGTSLYGLYLACVHYGFNVSAWYLDSASGIRVNDLVVLLLDGEYHFTLIKAINETSVLLADSSFGILDLDLDDFEDLFSGYVLDLNSTDERGQRLNVELMGNITGTFFPLVVLGAYVSIAVTVAVVGYLAYKFSPQIRSAATKAGNWVYNNRKSIATALICTGINALSNVWPKKDAVTRKLETFKGTGKGDVSYSSSTGKFTIGNYGSYSYSTLVSKGISAALLAEVQSKILYNTYLKSKPKERNKVEVPEDAPNSYKLFKRDADAYRKGKYKFLPGPDGGDDEHQIASLLIKDAFKNYKYGCQLIKEGETGKGTIYIVLAFWETGLIPGIIQSSLSPI